mmetsp:Transcript_75921/g.209953  ORF Transcript_75921/g.209953 Transcript_75921/m.209953 type:complete len:260 (+) Transcript_75921:390-1169(+)
MSFLASLPSDTLSLSPGANLKVKFFLLPSSSKSSVKTNGGRRGPLEAAACASPAGTGVSATASAAVSAGGGGGGGGCLAFFLPLLELLLLLLLLSLPSLPPAPFGEFSARVSPPPCGPPLRRRSRSGEDDKPCARRASFSAASFSNLRFLRCWYSALKSLCFFAASLLPCCSWRLWLFFSPAGRFSPRSRSPGGHGAFCCTCVAAAAPALAVEICSLDRTQVCNSFTVSWCEAQSLRKAAGAMRSNNEVPLSLFCFRWS